MIHDTISSKICCCFSSFYTHKKKSCHNDKKCIIDQCEAEATIKFHFNVCSSSHKLMIYLLSTFRYQIRSIIYHSLLWDHFSHLIIFNEVFLLNDINFMVLCTFFWLLDGCLQQFVYWTIFNEFVKVLQQFSTKIYLLGTWFDWNWRLKCSQNKLWD